MILGDDAVNVGIGLTGDVTFLGPTNKLEINAGPGYTRPSAVTGASGLQFRQLNNSCNPQANGGNQGVLALDANGNVIYVDGGGFGKCPTPTVLTTDVGLDFNEWNVHFQDPATVPPLTRNNAVGIGIPCSTSPLGAKLDDISNTATTGNYIFRHNISGHYY